MTVKELLQKDIILLDGGFGTELIKKGLQPHEDSVSAIFSHPQWVKEIHRSYIDAGSNIIMADTFGANACKLKGAPYTVEECVNQAVKLAKEAAEGTEALVALDVSTTGELLYPAGRLTFEDAYNTFKQVAISGEKAGVDLVCLETFTDLKEARIALLAVKENTDLPVFVTLSFDENSLTMNGSTPSAVAVTLKAAGADAVGLNCSLGPDKLKGVAEEFLKYSPIPVIVKPNAGLPDPKTGSYTMNATDFAEYMAEFYEKGVLIMGGCCGTTPEYIKSLKEKIKDTKKGVRENIITDVICGVNHTVELNEPRVIGERINPTGKKRFKQALEENDLDYILNEGISQVEAGAEILDVNVGHSGIDEKEMMSSVVKSLQGSIGLPLQLDSTSPSVLEKALRVYTGKAIINSVNGEEKSLNSVLPLAKKYGAAVVGLTLDENGIPETADERVKIAEKIINRALTMGIPKEDIIIDCLTMTVSANQGAATITLEAMKKVKEKFGVKTTLGVSNVSFGLPSRETVNTAFVTLALENGLDLPIMNPNSAPMIGAVRAFRVLKGFDTGACDYINAFSDEVKTAVQVKEITLSEAIEKGLKTQAADMTSKALTEKSADEIINGVLIPALDTVGEKFESGKLFLPQLIRSADAAGACFEIIKRKMAKSNSAGESKGKIILATVKGDVHDIGKNIVKTVLENYGYEVIDLGKDVSPEDVLKAQQEIGAELVGLSALMTTTLPSMEETIKVLHSNNAPCKIMVGGAVLTPEYAEKIGADFYAKDAKMSADIAKRIFN
ncbi:MAG: homocysteine S-methyltransferase family protein [Clostridia bacterium]|nr:homocysteine S-methyltransferase family protein [Clostridia bacterium]